MYRDMLDKFEKLSGEVRIEELDKIAKDVIDGMIEKEYPNLEKELGAELLKDVAGGTAVGALGGTLGAIPLSLLKKNKKFLGIGAGAGAVLGAYGGYRYGNEINKEHRNLLRLELREELGKINKKATNLLEKFEKLASEVSVEELDKFANSVLPYLSAGAVLGAGVGSLLGVSRVMTGDGGRNKEINRLREESMKLFRDNLDKGDKLDSILSGARDDIFNDINNIKDSIDTVEDFNKAVLEISRSRTEGVLGLNKVANTSALLAGAIPAGLITNKLVYDWASSPNKKTLNSLHEGIAAQTRRKDRLDKAINEGVISDDWLLSSVVGDMQGRYHPSNLMGLEELEDEGTSFYGDTVDNYLSNKGIDINKMKLKDYQDIIKTFNNRYVNSVVENEDILLDDIMSKRGK